MKNFFAAAGFKFRMAAEVAESIKSRREAAWSGVAALRQRAGIDDQHPFAGALAKLMVDHGSAILRGEDPQVLRSALIRIPNFDRRSEIVDVLLGLGALTVLTEASANTGEPTWLATVNEIATKLAALSRLDTVLQDSPDLRALNPEGLRQLARPMFSELDDCLTTMLHELATTATGVPGGWMFGTAVMDTYVEALEKLVAPLQQLYPAKAGSVADAAASIRSNNQSLAAVRVLDAGGSLDQAAIRDALIDEEVTLVGTELLRRLSSIETANTVDIRIEVGNDTQADDLLGRLSAAIGKGHIVFCDAALANDILQADFGAQARMTLLKALAAAWLAQPGDRHNMDALKTLVKYEGEMGKQISLLLNIPLLAQQPQRSVLLAVFMQQALAGNGTQLLERLSDDDMRPIFLGLLKTMGNLEAGEDHYAYSDKSSVMDLEVVSNINLILECLNVADVKRHLQSVSTDEALMQAIRDKFSISPLAGLWLIEH